MRTLPLRALVVCSAGLAAGLSAEPAQSQPVIAVRLANMRAGQGLRDAAFTVTRRVEVQLDGIGAGKKRGYLYAYGWLVDADAHRMLWSMLDAEPQGSTDGGHQMRFVSRRDLEPGRYRLYFYAGRRMELKGALDLTDLFAPATDDRSGWEIEVRVPEVDRDAFDLQDIDPESAEDTLRLAPLGHDAFRRIRFRLEQPGRVHILALGEAYARGNQLADRSWLRELVSRRLVWEMTAADSEPAGGARKNRRQEVTLELPAGAYELAAVTDDSHAYGDWNALPPYTPEAWGVELRAPLDTLRRDDLPEEHTVARLTGVHDDEHLTARVHVDRPLRVRVYAVGEWSSASGEMVDRGWIEDLGNGREVWRMVFEGSMHAGGASKNRSVDQSLVLPPGEYRIHYATDDSHSPERWNALPPFDAQAWGLDVTTFEDGGFTLLDLDVAKTGDSARR